MKRYDFFSRVRLQREYLLQLKAPKALIERVTNVDEIKFVTGDLDLEVTGDLVN